MESGISIFRVDDILVAHASADLKIDSEPVLDRLANLLQDRPEIRIEIHGHTDNTGTPAQNQVLSEARARAVIVSLITRGISAERLSSEGFGESKPIASNKTEEGRAQNRRVEIKIIR
jgi:outer membrane protein OmpA-like peptidoglycan-associated protein